MEKKQTIPDQIWQFFSSVKLTVYTLLLLALTSIIGTVVLQNGAPAQYIRLYGRGMTNLILALGLDDMYHVWWFLLLLVVLCINILVCSVERLSHTWKIIFPKTIKVNPDRFRKLKTSHGFDSGQGVEALAESFSGILSKKIGPVIRTDSENSIGLYAENGRWTRIGVYLVHASVLLLLLGALIGSVFGFKADLKLDEGESADAVVPNQTRIPVPLGFTIKCNEFEVKFYDTGAPEEFRSNLTILEGGRESFTTNVRVNHPLRYKGINIFQSSYGAASPESAVFTILDNETQEEIHREIRLGEAVDLPGSQGSFTFQGFLPHFDFQGHNLGEAFFGKIDIRNGESVQIALPTRFPTFDKMRKGRFAVVVKDFEQRFYTGLQVTKDPGVWYVYAGFILMILGCWVTFFMAHNTYFIEIARTREGGSRILVAGKTNRNPQGMKLTLKKLVRRLEK
ncbi:cytochrome c biogenesis protein ResB [Desulfospira joergensenii]|uniref:cytochrome c biogenesis protein ResB n=1 Tax=Desulfospira joergensenii TaxID=53329 RepID=UPI00040DBB05|nr:cytochrome c biogenesis protein ResB [Desulfospira joergensenii]